MELIKVYFFKGWKKREIRDFFISLVLTIIFCLILLYIVPLLHNDVTANTYHYYNTI